MQIISAFIAGLIFALGLGISGMTQPDKVIGFLDIFGTWDPTLLWVMAGAITVNLALFKMILRRQAPLFNIDFTLPRHDKIDVSMLIGAGLFGIGWGMTGYCPGPALTSLVITTPEVITYVGAMIAGMYLYKWFPPKQVQTAAAASMSQDDLVR